MIRLTRWSNRVAMVLICSVALFVAVATASAWSPTDPVGPQFTEAEKTDQRIAGTNILAQLRSAAANYRPAFTIPPGEYRLSAASGEYPILSGIRDMVITATGATFWFDAPHTWGLKFDSCVNVQVTGLTMDCDPAPHSQGMITAIDYGNSTMDLVVMDGYRMALNGETRATILYRPDGTFIKRGHTTGEVTVLGGRTIRVKSDLSGAAVGNYLVLSQRTGQFLQVVNCSAMLFQDVNLWAGGGMAVLESGGYGNNTYRRLKATRRPGGNRLHAFGADGFHMKNTTVGPTIDQCEVAYTSDDLLNIHGYFAWVSSRTDARNLRVLGSSSPFYIGQKLDFWGEVSVEPHGSARITRVTQVTDTNLVAQAKVGMPSSWSADVYDVTLDADVAPVAGDIIEHHNQVCDGFVVKNSFFHDTFNRAFLINGSPNGLVSSNTFAHINSGGISVAMETWSYMEGQFPHGTIIESNRLVDMPGISVSMNPKGPAGPHRHRTINDITIRHNYVESPIKVMHTDTARVLSNTVVMNLPANWSRPVVSEDFYGSSYGDAIYLSVVANVNVVGNTVTWNNPGGDNVRFGPLTANIWSNGIPQWESIADFNTGWFIDGLQGDAGWRYGWADGALVRTAQYQTNLFQQFPVCDGSWRISAGGIPFCGKYDVHPDPTRAVVRRWASSVTAPLRVQGRVQTGSTSGNSTVAYIFAGGALKWSNDNAGGQVNAFDVNLGTISAGTPVDLVIDSKGNSDYDSTTMSAMILRAPAGSGAPAPPTGLNATTLDWRTIELTWDRSPGTETYTVKRSTTSGGPYTSIATGISETSFVDASASVGGNYYYVVSAGNWAGDSGNSGELHWPVEPGGNFIKADNADPLNQGSSWLGSVVPGAQNLALWTNTLAGASRLVPLGGDLSWSGLRVYNPGGGITLAAGNVLTLGPAGIALASQNLVVSNAIVVGTNQTWSLGSKAIFFRGALRGSNVVLTITGSTSSYMDMTGSAAGFDGIFNYGAAARLRLRGGFEGTGLTLNLTTPASVSAEGTIGTVRIGELTTANTSAVLGNSDQNGSVTYAVGFLGSNSVWAGRIQNGTAPTSIQKVGLGTWTLSGSNTYTGPTTVSVGTLRVNNATGSGTGTGAVTVNAGATLAGTGIINGPVFIQPGAFLCPGPVGDGIGLLTMNNTVNLSGETKMTVNRLNSPTASKLGGVSILTCGGCLTVTNGGALLQAGDRFSLFSATNFAGSFSEVHLPSLPAGLRWNTNALMTGGTLSVVAVIPPHFGLVSRLGADLLFSGSGGGANESYYLLTSTNLSVPVESWLCVLTNQFDGDGNFAFTYAVEFNLPQRFYRLLLP